MGIPDKSEDVQSFNRRASGYEASFTQRLFFDPVQRVVLDLASSGGPPEAILDIGCGTGRLLRKAAARWPGAHLMGLDPADGMIRQARQRSPHAAFFSGLAEALPLPDASVDLILSTLSFHHWEDQRQGIREVARVLRPGGHFVLADLLLPLRIPRLFPHGRQAEPAAVRAMFASAGLRVLHQRRRWSHFILVTLAEPDLSL